MGMGSGFGPAFGFLRRGAGTSRTAFCGACTSTVASGRVMVTGPAGGWLYDLRLGVAL